MTSLVVCVLGFFVVKDARELLDRQRVVNPYYLYTPHRYIVLFLLPCLNATDTFLHALYIRIQYSGVYCRRPSVQPRLCCRLHSLQWSPSLSRLSPLFRPSWGMYIAPFLCKALPSHMQHQQQKMNEYEQAIMSVGKILSDYDQSQRYAVR